MKSSRGTKDLLLLLSLPGVERVDGSQSDGVSLPTLVLMGGPLDGTEFPLRMSSREVSIGSSGGSDIQIALGNVEPVHAQLLFGSEGLSIADVGSATGTFLNGEKVEEEAVLHDGDRICLGPPGARESAKLLVRLPGGTAAALAPEPSAAPSAPSFIDEDPGPVLIGGEDHAAVDFGGDAPWPPPEADKAPPSPPVPQAEQILEADDVVVDTSVVIPDEAPPEPTDALFSDPLPLPPDVRPVKPAPPPPPPPAPAAKPAAPPAPPAPPPPPPRAAAPLTAPLPEEQPPPPAEMPRLLDDSPPRPRAGSTGTRSRKPVRRARRSSFPLVPVVGGVAVVAAIAGGGWWFFLREAPAAARVPGAAPGAAPVAAPANAPAGTAPSAAPARPQATHLEPDVALPGQTIEIRGQLPTGPVSVMIAGVAAQVGEATAEVIKVAVPNLSLPAGQTVQVEVKVGATSLPPLDLVLGRLPLVLKITPPSGPVGERVVLAGRGFDPQPAGNRVTFGDEPALVLSASPTEVAVVVPMPRHLGLPEVPVVVSAQGRTSASDRTFAIQRAVTSSFVPRFYAAVVAEAPGEDLAFVSTELGPVLLLGGPTGSITGAARAVDLAERLNALVARAPTRRVDIELRDGPPAAVAVVGEPSPLVSATSVDAAAYARGWEPGSRSGPSLSPAALTRYWAALLKDYFGLFLYRERPLEVAALSSRGQVFIDIYGEALRRASGGTGVSASIVSPTTEAMARSLRLAALVPSGGTPREEIAVMGRWQGTIDAPDTGARRFEVRFTSEKKGLDGSIKTWRGSLELKAPLRDISFRRGTLRFTTDLQGTPHHFEGTLHDTTITGSATREGRSPAPFSLEFVE